jgi:hypothetical protein
LNSMSAIKKLIPIILSEKLQKKTTFYDIFISIEKMFVLGGPK